MMARLQAVSPTGVSGILRMLEFGDNIYTCGLMARFPPPRNPVLGLSQSPEEVRGVEVTTNA
jgi:hypothetical protein